MDLKMEQWISQDTTTVLYISKGGMERKGGDMMGMDLEGRERSRRIWRNCRKWDARQWVTGYWFPKCCFKKVCQEPGGVCRFYYGFFLCSIWHKHYASLLLDISNKKFTPLCSITLLRFYFFFLVAEVHIKNVDMLQENAQELQLDYQKFIFLDLFDYLFSSLLWKFTKSLASEA